MLEDLGDVDAGGVMCEDAVAEGRGVPGHVPAGGHTALV